MPTAAPGAGHTGSRRQWMQLSRGDQSHQTASCLISTRVHQRKENESFKGVRRPRRCSLAHWSSSLQVLSHHTRWGIGFPPGFLLGEGEGLFLCPHSLGQQVPPGRGGPLAIPSSWEARPGLVSTDTVYHRARATSEESSLNHSDPEARFPLHESLPQKSACTCVSMHVCASDVYTCVCTLCGVYMCEGVCGCVHGYVLCMYVHAHVCRSCTHVCEYVWVFIMHMHVPVCVLEICICVDVYCSACNVWGCTHVCRCTLCMHGCILCTHMCMAVHGCVLCHMPVCSSGLGKWACSPTALCLLSSHFCTASLCPSSVTQGPGNKIFLFSIKHCHMGCGQTQFLRDWSLFSPASTRATGHWSPTPEASFAGMSCHGHCRGQTGPHS